MSSRRVLAVARFPVGGIRTYLRDLFAAPSMRDHEFVLIAPNDEGLDEYIAKKQLRCSEWIPTAPSLGAFAQTVARALRRLHPAFVHSHGFTSGVVCGVPTRLAGYRHLLTVHDVLVEDQLAGFKGEVRRLGLSLSLMLPDMIHCVTEDSKQNLVRYCGRVPGLERRTVVIHHGVDTDKITQAQRRDISRELGCAPGTVVFGFLGRFMAQKGFRVLIDAMRSLKESGIEAHRVKVLAVGSGGFLRQDQERIASFGLQDDFVFWPYQADVASILKGIDCLVMPSLWEASGLLAMEAMVAGTPVIGTHCIGLRETLADSPSIRVEPGDSAALGRALREFLETPHTTAAGKFVPEAIDRYSGDRAFSRLRSLYDRLV